MSAVVGPEHEEFDALTASLSSILQAAGPSTLDSVVAESLALFGAFAGVDRTFATLIDDDGIVTDDWEWAQQGCPLIGAGVGTPFRDVNGSAIKLLRRGRTVAAADLAEIDVSPSERDFIVRNRVRAVVLCPIRVGHTFLGVIGLTKLDEPRQWDAALLDQIEIVARLLARAIARARDRGALALATARARRIADFIPDGLLMLTTEGCINWVSPSFTRTSGRELSDLEGRPATELMHPDDASQMVSGLAHSSEEPRSMTVRLCVDDEWRWSELSWRLVSEPGSGAPDEIVLSIRDVHSERLRAAELARQALTDPLTSVCNRDGLDRALAGLGERYVALAFCDIDRFKEVNDRHGHAVGDELLRALARALRAAVRPQDVVARVGGDEFVVVLVDTTPVDAAMLEHRLQAAVDDIRTLGGVGATASIGLSETGPASTAATLRVSADDAMYRAKRSVAHR